MKSLNLQLKAIQLLFCMLLSREAGMGIKMLHVKRTHDDVHTCSSATANDACLELEWSKQSLLILFMVCH